MVWQVKTTASADEFRTGLSEFQRACSRVDLSDDWSEALGDKKPLLDEGIILIPEGHEAVMKVKRWANEADPAVKVDDAPKSDPNPRRWEVSVHGTEVDEESGTIFVVHHVRSRVPIKIL